MCIQTLWTPCTTRPNDENKKLKSDVFLQTSNFDQKDSYFVYNHIDLTIKYHSGKTEPWGIDLGEGGGRVVGKILTL